MHWGHTEVMWNIGQCEVDTGRDYNFVYIITPSLKTLNHPSYLIHFRFICNKVIYLLSRTFVQLWRWKNTATCSTHSPSESISVQQDHIISLTGCCQFVHHHQSRRGCYCTSTSEIFEALNLFPSFTRYYTVLEHFVIAYASFLMTVQFAGWWHTISFCFLLHRW